MSTTMKSASIPKSSSTHRSSHKHHSSHKSNGWNKFCKSAKNVATDANTYIGAGIAAAITAPTTFLIQKTRYLNLNKEVCRLQAEGKI